MHVRLIGSSKFHLFELGAQLDQRGWLTMLHTGYPRRRVESLGVPSSLIDSYPCFTPPMMALWKLGQSQSSLSRELEWQANDALDRHASHQVETGDVVWAISCHGLHSGRRAQRIGGRFVCDRAVLHIAVQDRVLREEYDSVGLPYSPIDPRKIEKERQEYAEADLIVAPSNAVKESFLAEGIRADRIAVLPLGADLSRFYPSAPKATDGLQLVFAGQVTIQKGLHVLAAALEMMPDADCSRIRLDLAGLVMPETQPFIDRIKARISVDVLGNIPFDRLRGLMSRAQALVLPSVQDGFGMVAPQAMACETAVIVSTGAGASEIVSHGKTGWVFENRRADELAGLLTHLLENPGLAESVGQEAMMAAKRGATWDHYGDQVQRQLEDLVRLRSA